MFALSPKRISSPNCGTKPAGRPAARPGARPAILSTRRGAFTLVELLVVIVILGILAALLLPALGRARVSATEGRVISEIKQLEAAIAAFKVKYGIEPPSRMVLYTTAADWNSDPANKAIIRRMWPQFDFSMPGGQGVAYPQAWGAPGAVVQLKAGECLLFFLGGVINNPASNRSPEGFAKNPAVPFAPKGAAANREGPFVEFAIDRIKDSDGNGLYEYVDPIPNQQNPYLYFSSYEGRGYRVTGVIDLPLTGAQYSSLQDVYRVANSTGPTAPPGATPPASPSGSQLLPPQKPQSFQIISPGYDGDYGLGGSFDSNQTNSALSSKADYDNLTNFHGGRLAQ